MHFSRPSGHRLSWWWPWNRGAVGRLSSGYCTVSTFRNISWKVTPNPLMGLRKSSTGDLLGARGAGGLADAGGRARAGQARAGRFGDPDAVVVGKVERGDPVTHPGPQAGRAARAGLRLGLQGRIRLGGRRGSALRGD